MHRNVGDLAMSALLGIAGLLIAAAVGLLVFATADFALGHTHTAAVGVIEKHYEPAHSSSGLAFGSNANGGSTTSVVTTSEAEKYVLIIARDGQTKSREVSVDEYMRAQPGQMMTLKFRRGRFTGLDW